MFSLSENSKVCLAMAVLFCSLPVVFHGLALLAVYVDKWFY